LLFIFTFCERVESMPTGNAPEMIGVNQRGSVAEVASTRPGILVKPRYNILFSFMEIEHAGLSAQLRSALAGSPAAALPGLRQVGKTTLARHVTAWMPEARGHSVLCGNNL
jgi:hypothetical protein